MPQDFKRSSRSFSITFLSKIPRDEHSEHHQIIPAGDSLPQDGPRKAYKDEHDRDDDIAQQFSNIPPPVPDTSPRTMLSAITYSRTTLPPFISTRSSSVADQPSVSSGATLTIPADSFTSLSLSVTSTARKSSIPSPNSLQHKGSGPSKFSTPVIAAIAGGSAFLVIVGLILLRVCSRPKRHERPKPSLPILDDPFPEEEICKTNESPLFGGKERFSSNNGNGGGIWSWAQRTKSTELPTIQCCPPPPTYDSYQARPEISVPTTNAGLLVPRPPPSQSVPTLGPSLLSAPSTHQATAVNSAVSLHRLSNKSVSLYPNSPLCEGGDTSFTAGHLDRGESAYDGADIASPLFLAQDLVELETAPTTIPSGGRSRIKSSYFSYTPGSYPRMSSVQSGLGTPKARDVDFDLQKLPPIHRSESRRGNQKANKAAILTAALGMASPSTTHIPVSPQPTLYPDDSLSVVDAKRSSKRLLHRKPTPKRLLRRSQTATDNASAAIRTPTLDSGTALGSLMLMEFGATSKSSGMLSETEAKGYGAGVGGGRSGNAGPPRVPSPPALPSLAQMGLEHANPEAYADYRCATYSICGLYEDRKSRAG